MIRYFTPQQGRLAGKRYHLPTYPQDNRIQRTRNTMQTMAKQDGAFDAAGNAPMPLDYATFSCTFDFTENYFLSPSIKPNGWDYYNGTADTTVALMNALLEFDVAVLEGGTGLLEDILGSGVVDPVTRGPITSLQCYAKIGTADTTIDKQAAKATAQVTWTIAGGGWYEQPSNQFVRFI